MRNLQRKHVAYFIFVLIAGVLVYSLRDRADQVRQSTLKLELSDRVSDAQFLQRQLTIISAGGSPRVTQHAHHADTEYYRSLQEAVDRLAETDSYDTNDLKICTATVEHTVCADPVHEIAKAAWEAKWKSRLVKYEVSGGCGCCVEDYTITGPRAAILEYPMHASLLEYYPRWHPNEEQ